MFAYEPSINPPCHVDEFKIDQLCKFRIYEVCKDILKRGEDTEHSEIYTRLYELIRDEIESN